MLPEIEVMRLSGGNDEPYTGERYGFEKYTSFMIDHIRSFKTNDKVEHSS